MKRTIPVYLRPAILLGIGFFIGVLIFSRSKFCTPTQAFCEPESQSDNEKQIHVLAPRYLEYSQSALALAQSQGTVVLYFWAPWCSTCSTLDLDIQKNPNLIPAGITVLRIDYDHATALRHRYNVITQHTFVQIDNQGNALSTWVGGDTQTWSTHLLFK